MTFDNGARPLQVRHGDKAALLAAIGKAPNEITSKTIAGLMAGGQKQETIMRYTPYVRSILFTVFVVLALAACGGGQTATQVEPTPTAVPPTSTSAPTAEPAAGQPAGAPAALTIPCAQLIPPDELKNLLFTEDSTLVENAYTGVTSCEWKYTPKDGTQASLFYLNAGFSEDTSVWEATRKSELSNEPSDLVVNSIDGLGDENYTWSSKTTGQYVVYVRQGSKTLILRYNPQDILFMGNESGIIDMAQRIFERIG